MDDVSFDYFDTRVVDDEESALLDSLDDKKFNESTTAGLATLRNVNARFRVSRWPKPFDRTSHRLICGDGSSIPSVEDASIDLVVTSPPYWTLKKYETSDRQLGDIQDYDDFLSSLDVVWRECERVLRPGGRICCVVGDVCLSRRTAGRHYVMPLHSDIQVRSRNIGLDCLTPILWHKIANAKLEVKGSGGSFMGKPYQPGGVVKNDVEYILMLRKPGGYRKPSQLQKSLSMLTKDELALWFRSVWSDIGGASTRSGHPAPYPVSLADRLIRMFSFAGDTILDPFLGTGSTSVAAIAAGRNSVGVEVEPKYFQMAIERIIAYSGVR